MANLEFEMTDQIVELNDQRIISMRDDPILAALARLEAGQNTITTRLTALETGQNTLIARMDQLEAGQKTMRTDFLDELGSTRGVLITRLDRLQARIDQVQEEAFTAFAQGEAVRRHSENTRTESRALVEEISGLVRQVRMLRSRLDSIEGP